MEIKQISLDETDVLYKNKIVVAIGFFDGIHKIHEKILRKAKYVANINNLDLGIVTFNIKIRDFLMKEDNRIQKNVYKYNIINDLFNPNAIFEIIVNDKVINKNYNTFMKYLKTILNVEKVIVGKNFRFGKSGSGNVKNLVEFFGKKNVFIISGRKKYSTSNIKKFIKQKRLDKAKKLSNHLIF